MAVKVVLEHEGGYSNDADDPGGETNFGITKKTLNAYGPILGIAHDVKDLTQDEAKRIYKIFWWDKFHYELINAPQFATKIMDMCVNIGAIRAHSIVQEALYYFGYKLAIDGYIGAITIKTLNEATATDKADALYQKICEILADYYKHLVAINPKLEKFLDGWLNRAKY